jgi:hypothetical protein
MAALEGDDVDEQVGALRSGGDRSIVVPVEVDVPEAVELRRSAGDGDVPPGRAKSVSDRAADGAGAADDERRGRQA